MLQYFIVDFEQVNVTWDSTAKREPLWHLLAQSQQWRPQNNSVKYVESRK